MSRNQNAGSLLKVTALILVCHVPVAGWAKKDLVVWDPGRINETLGLGESSETTTTFVSGRTLEHADLWVVPELRPYVSVQPDSFEVIPENSPVDVTVRFSVPFGTRPATYEGTVHLRTGRSTHPANLKIKLEVAGLDLSPPSEQAVDRAQIIHERIPEARLHFSRVHGGLMLVEAGVIEAEAEDPTLPVPLADSHGTDRGGRVSTMLEYFDRFKEAYGLSSPTQELLFPERSFTGGSGDTGIASNLPSVATETLVQAHNGIRIHGRYAHGFFDRGGNLGAVLTRLLPAGPVTGDQAAFTPAEALSLTLSKGDELMAFDPDLSWLGELDPNRAFEHAVELVYLPMGPGGDAELRLAYRLNLRSNVRSALVYLDALDGAVLRASSATPTGWYDAGTTFPVWALDEIGGARRILTTEDPETKRWYMGIASSYVDGDGRQFFGPGNFFSISDADHSSDVSPATLSIDTSDSNTWVTDPDYNSIEGRRAATGLMLNVMRILSWWHDRGWQSWDGRGSTLWASVKGGRRGRLNASGGWGTILVGDGTTPFGLTLASSLEVMGHEFMHSVITATSDLEYEGESGAINESLADLFGVALTAVGDRYNDETFGEDVGLPGRNLVDPTRSELGIQPDTYSSFLSTERDAGGVHTNSGILNKAHSLVVQGGDFFGYTVDAMGVSRTTDLLRRANRLPAYPPEVSLEEYAAAVSGYCWMIDHLFRSVGIPRIDDLCDAFGNAYRATELLPGRATRAGLYPDIKVEGATVSFPGRYGSAVQIRLEVTNIGPRPEFNMTDYSISLTNASGETISPDSADLCTPYDPILEPGETKCLLVRFPRDFVDYLSGAESLTVRVEPSPRERDPNLLNNWTRIRIGADYYAKEDVSSASWYTPVLRNGAVEFTFHAVNVVYLQRDTQNGPFTRFKEEVRVPDRSDTPFQVPPVLPYDPEELVEIKNTVEIPGRAGLRQAWFDPDGGLPELEGKQQYYLLVDCRGLAPELDETNNFFCLNCVPEGWTWPGVLMRFPKGAPVGELFPTEYNEAAVLLPSEYQRELSYTSIEVPRLNPRLTPDTALP